ncbi:NAD(P)-dependent alcohol dehydrogenase (plasmid) [Haloferax mediterranei ATCC 33500]|uniref:NAD(P)-dependent alcohol dehydrogenase n=3 Tax=Haloferacaceae TaxID=1644056 RepID=I3R9Z9_HALMT|nr:NAD(P)-dependent alcohol dehydrogenase [Haloferax mediterranei]AFK21059.1 putative zinc-binding oxidoreductase [Haloferax mediterranei ATCC 33500]EMA05157.1 putative zinc-binding oxidoreductase [Haloferax mediterranei ATCC 33500]QCQ77362.1 NAD(P)-dependent alcohol dehydrogenase [Haloferax mediterranei ATCC 33500]
MTVDAATGRQDGDKMNAVVYSEYGDPSVFEQKEVDRPTPNDSEVLIDVRAASVNAGDCHLMRGSPFLVRFMYGGILQPKLQILGMDVAGRVEVVGKNVTRFHPGDAVFGDVSKCGFGGFADYVVATADTLVMKSADVSFEEAAVVPTAAVTALQGLRGAGQIQSGQNVLINGASGGVGTFAVQIAKSFGADVTGVCSTEKMEIVRSIGADRVIDYTREEFTEHRQSYDLILDTAASHSLFDYKRALTPEGTYVMVGGPVGRLFQAMIFGPLLSVVGSKNLRNLLMEPNKDDLAFVKELLETGTVKPVIDSRYALAEVPEAIRYLEEGRAKGKVLVTLDANGS